tara:strand:- start:14990 stop:18259 length:3270 start_codon:yes stop_codon:yes gene_type:complete
MNRQKRLYFLKNQLSDLRSDKKSEEVIRLLKSASPPAEPPLPVVVTEPPIAQPEPVLEGEAQEEPPNPNQSYQPTIDDTTLAIPPDIGALDYESLTEEQLYALSQIFTPQFRTEYTRAFGSLASAISEDIDHWTEIRTMYSQHKEYTDPAGALFSNPLWKGIAGAYDDMVSHFDSADVHRESISEETKQDVIQALEDGVITDELIMDGVEDPQSLGVGSGPDSSNIIDQLHNSLEKRNNRIANIISLGLIKDARPEPMYDETGHDYTHTPSSYSEAPLCSPGEWSHRDGGSQGTVTGENAYNVLEMPCVKIVFPIRFGDNHDDWVIYYRESNGNFKLRNLRYTSEYLASYLSGKGQGGRLTNRGVTRETIDANYEVIMEQMSSSSVGARNNTVDYGDGSQYTTHDELDPTNDAGPQLRTHWERTGDNQFANVGEYSVSDMARLIAYQRSSQGGNKKVHYTTGTLHDLFTTTWIESVFISLEPYATVMIEGTHILLDVAGLIPHPYAAGFDLSNSCLYCAREMYLMAALCILTMIPILDWALTPVKWGARFGKRVFLDLVAANAELLYKLFRGGIVDGRWVSGLADHAIFGKYADKVWVPIERMINGTFDVRLLDGLPNVKRTPSVAARETDEVLSIYANAESKALGGELGEEAAERAVREELGEEVIEREIAEEVGGTVRFPREAHGSPTVARAQFAADAMVRMVKISGRAALELIKTMWASIGNYSRRVQDILNLGKKEIGESAGQASKFKIARRMLWRTFMVWLPWFSATFSLILGARARIRLKELWDQLLEEGMLDEELGLLGISKTGISPGESGSLIPIEDMILNPEILNRKAQHYSRGCPQGFESLNGEITIDYTQPAVMRTLWSDSIDGLFANPFAGQGVLRPGGAPQVTPEESSDNTLPRRRDHGHIPISELLSEERIANTQGELLSDLESAIDGDKRLITDIPNDLCSGEHLLAAIKVARWSKVVAMNEIQYSAMKCVFLSDFALIYGRHKYKFINGAAWTIGDLTYNIKMAHGELGPYGTVKRNYIAIEQYIQEVAGRCLQFLESIEIAQRHLSKSPEAGLDIENLRGQIESPSVRVTPE